MNQELLQNIKDLYGMMLADTHDKSLSYRAMENSLRTFLLYADSDKPENKARQLGTLALAIAGARSYVNTHKRNPSTSTGKKRIELAMNLLKNTQDLEDDLKQEEVDEQIQNYIGNPHASEQKNDAKDELKSLSRMHRGAATHIVPDYKPDIAHEGRGEKAYRTGVHGLTTLVRAIGFVIPGLMIRVWRGIRHIGRSVTGTQPVYEQEERDSNRIPGSRNRESFEMVHPEASGDDQPIIDDIRRTPLIWEHEVLDDPNQPPTMTLKAKESTPDSINSTDTDGDVGHAFITLSYSKPDPVTGKLARYETTFGFYPGMELGNMTGKSENDVYGQAFHATAGTLGTNGPGELVNDHDHPYDAGITYTVTNKQINKVLCAAQNYAALGYNMTTRNCASFVNDMASAAGLNTGNLFEKVDFHLDGKTSAKTAGAALLADHFRNKTNGILREHTKTQSEHTYQTFGQKLITEQDVKQMKTKDFNTRLYGYDPSHVAESMKNRTDYKVQFLADPTKHVAADEYGLSFNSDMSAAGHGLVQSIGQYLQDHDLEDKTLEDEIDFLAQTYNDRITYELKIGMDGIFSALKKKPAGMDAYNVRVEALKRASKHIKEFEDKLNSVFSDTLHSDPELRSSFAHFINQLELVRRDCNDRKAELDVALASGNLTDAYDTPVPNKGFMKTRRECSEALTKFYGSDLAATAASILVFGDPNTYANKCKRMNELTKDGLDRITYSEYDEYLALRHDIRVMPDMIKQQQHFAQAKHFSKGDIDFIFVDLAGKAPYHKEMNTVYQTFAWDHVFPDLRSRLTTALGALRNPDRQAQLKAISDVLAEVQKNNSEEYKNILNAFVRCEEEHNPFDCQKSAAEYHQEVLQHAATACCVSLNHCFFGQEPLSDLNVKASEMIPMLSPMFSDMAKTHSVSRTLHKTMKPFENIRENYGTFYNETQRAITYIAKTACSEMHNLYKSEKNELVHNLAKYITGLAIAKISDQNLKTKALDTIGYGGKNYDDFVKAVEHDKRFINAMLKPTPLKFADFTSGEAFANAANRCSDIVDKLTPKINKTLASVK